MVHLMEGRSAVLFLLAGLTTPAVAQTAKDSSTDPVPELGAVRFARDLDVVLMKTLKTEPNKPLFLLFQEIPG